MLNNIVKNKTGFTLLETLIVIGIIGLLASSVMVFLGNVPPKARDAKRKAEISSIGKIISQGCYVPSAGDGDYDITEIVTEWRVDNPEYAKLVAQIPQDPKTGTDSLSNYRYQISDNGAHCVIYANLENEAEEVDLPDLTEPTPGGGSGVLQAISPGVNNSTKYYQVAR